MGIDVNVLSVSGIARRVIRRLWPYAGSFGFLAIVAGLLIGAACMCSPKTYHAQFGAADQAPGGTVSVRAPHLVEGHGHGPITLRPGQHLLVRHASGFGALQVSGTAMRRIGSDPADFVALGAGSTVLTATHGQTPWRYTVVVR